MTELRIDGLKVEIVRSARRTRSASLKYLPQGHFVLSVPVQADTGWVENFLLERRRWMQKTHRKSAESRMNRLIPVGARIETEFYSVMVEQDPALSYPKYRVARSTKEKSATFYLAPEFFSPENSDKLYTNLEKYLLAQLVREGSPSLVDRARYWAQLHNIQVKEIFVRVQKSRLGYCTHDNRIMLNGRLLFAPQKIRDYVICHELAHTKHHNHSKAYWAYLEKIFPGAKATDKLLRNEGLYGMRVLPPPAPASRPIPVKRPGE